MFDCRGAAEGLKPCPCSGEKKPLKTNPVKTVPSILRHYLGQITKVTLTQF